MTDQNLITPSPFFTKVLVANRGAIACRVLRTLRRLGIRSVAVFSEADAHSLHVQEADEAVLLGPAQSAASYLRGDRILEVAQAAGVGAIHPGYGFLSENAEFAAACARANLVFVGPTPEQIAEFGMKHRARSLAQAAGVPLLPGSGLIPTLEEARRIAQDIGYPIMLKSTAGGGGIGMLRVDDPDALNDAWLSVQRLAGHHFANSGVFVERFITAARHVEVQILGNGRGQVVAIGDRDCSAQRRNQKVIEEAPAPQVPQDVRAAMFAAAEKLGAIVAYRNAGTVEFLYDATTREFFFLEVNTRLQVEHGVTEAVTGIDLVEWMLRIAATPGLDLTPLRKPAPKGHAIQVRIYAEDPGRNFQPAAGLLTEVVFPATARIDTWVESGTEVSPFYDPMLAKLIVHGEDRDEALGRLQQALDATRLHGIETNLPYLRQVTADPTFRAGAQTTRWLGTVRYQARTLDVLDPGTQTSVQDWPGRIGYWDIGVPPSGPMDSFAFRIGNALVGNPPAAAGLEFTITGPRLRFNCKAIIALTGATMSARLDDHPIPFWIPLQVESGQTLLLGSIEGGGARAYLAVRGGIDVPEVMGSRATFALGRMGGHGGRPLRPGDVLHLGTASPASNPVAPPTSDAVSPTPSVLKTYPRKWELLVLYGPHGAPEFFTASDMETFFATAWEVHYNSSRTGVRLLGPKPQWARPDGGEAGLHPSNIHDNAYAIGTVDFTGDMPVILGPDGPSLGGFVCPVTVIEADLWKLGQLRPGDRVRFTPVSHAEARRRARELEDTINAWRRGAKSALPETVPNSRLTARDWIAHGSILHRIPAAGSRVEVLYRPAGDCYLLVEYGPIELDLALRFRVQALLEWLRKHPIDGLQELTPGVRSLQIHYQPDQLPREQLLERLIAAEEELQNLEAIDVPSRIVHLPLAWDDSQTQLATRKYTQSVRADAPWCPRNIEFIRRVNGLQTEDEVKRIVFAASYLVMGLGDVYLSAPLATPLDPRHRLVTTKYNPARTWTPENAVGIGGAYLCIYGMEGPGGYQFVGRTLQVWNRYHRTRDFSQPWLLRFFDQIRFYEVEESELLAMREEFPRGKLALRIEETRFSLAAYRNFLEENAESIAAFRERQRTAFQEERERWARAETEVAINAPALAPQSLDEETLGGAEIAISSHVAGSIWSLAAKEGQFVHAGDTLMVIESMKMEIPVTAPEDGRIVRLSCREGGIVQPGTRLLVLEKDILNDLIR
jgi:urea carboxylase